MIILFVIFVHILYKYIAVVKRIQLIMFDHLLHYRYINYITNMNDFSKNYFYVISLNLIRLIIYCALYLIDYKSNRII